VLDEILFGITMDEDEVRRPDPFTLANNIRVLLGFADSWKDTQTKPFKYVTFKS
jgi:hypothetical protein